MSGGMAAAESQAEPDFLSCRAIWMGGSVAPSGEAEGGSGRATDQERRRWLREWSKKRQAGSGRRSGACSRRQRHAIEGAWQGAVVAVAVMADEEATHSNVRSVGAEQSQHSNKRRQNAHVALASRPQQATTLEAMHPRPRQCGPILAMCRMLEPTTQMQRVQPISR